MADKNWLNSLLEGVARGTLFHEIPDAAVQAGRELVQTGKDKFRGASDSFFNEIKSRRERQAQEEEARKMAAQKAAQAQKDAEDKAAFDRRQSGNLTVGEKLGDFGLNQYFVDGVQDSVQGLAKGVLRAFPRAIVATGRSLAQGIDGFAGGTPGSEEFNMKPESRLGKILLGDEEIKTVQNRGVGNTQFLKEHGVGGPGGQILGFGGATLATGLDLFPVGGAKNILKDGVEQIAKSESDDAVRLILKNLGKADIDIEKVLPQLVESTDKGAIKKIVKSLPDEVIPLKRGEVSVKGGEWYTQNEDFANHVAEEVGGKVNDYSIPRKDILDLSNPAHRQMLEKKLGEIKTNEILQDGFNGVPSAGIYRESPEVAKELDTIAKKMGFKGMAFSETDAKGAFKGQDVVSYRIFDKKNVKEGVAGTPIKPGEAIPNTPIEPSEQLYKEASNQRQTVDAILGRDQVDKIKLAAKGQKYTDGVPTEIGDDVLEQMRYSLNDPNLTKEEALQMVVDAPSRDTVKGAKAIASDFPTAKMGELIPGNEASDRNSVEFYKRQVRSGKGVEPALVTKEGDGFRVIDGNHRLQALKELGHESMPINETSQLEHVFNNLNKDQQDELLQLVDDADRIQAQVKAGGNDPKSVQAAQESMKAINDRMLSIGRQGALQSTPEREVAGLLLHPDEAAKYNDIAEARRQDFGAKRNLDDISQKPLPELPEPTPDVPLPKGKERGFITTAKDSPTTLEDVRQKISGEYESISNEETIKKAQAVIDEDESQALADVMTGEANTENFAKGLLLAEKLQKSGQTHLAVSIIERIAEKATELGQAIQALTVWNKLSPEGVNLYAQRMFKKALSPKRQKALEAESTKIAEELTKINKGALDDVIGEVGIKYRRVRTEKKVEAAQQLADRVSTHLSTSKSKKDPVKDMVNMLYEIAKKDLPQKTRTFRQPIELIGDAIRNAGEYSKVWGDAQKRLYSKYADNPAALDTLDEYFAHALNRPYSETKLTGAIANQLKENGTIVSELVRKHYTSVNAEKDTLVNQLVDLAGFQKDEAQELADDIGKRFMEITGERKRAILEGMAKERKAPIRKEMLDQLVEMSNLGGLSKEEYYGLAAKKLKLPFLDRDLADDLYKKADEMQLLDGVEKDQKALEILKSIADRTDTKTQKFFKVLTEYRYGNLLSSPLTHTTNIATNITQVGGLAPATKLTSGAIDFIASKLSGKARERYVAEVPAFYKGMFNSMGDAFKSAAEVVTGKRMIKKPDINNLPTSSPLSAPGRGITRVLEAGDVFFTTLARAGEKESLALRFERQGRGVTEQQLNDMAEENAQYWIFRKALDPENKTGQGHLLSYIDRMTGAINHLQKVPGVKWFIPFVQTPMNILKQGIEYSPAGFLTVAGSTKKTDQVAKAVLGSMVLGGAAALVMNGDSTWEAPRSKADREAFYASGARPYSVKIGDKWVSYSKLGPLSYPIAMAAAWKYYSEQDPEAFDKGAGEKFVSALGGMAGFFADQSYMKGLGDIVKASEGDLTSAEKTLTNLASQTVPLSSLQNWVAKIMDPIYRDPKNIAEGIAVRVPGLSKEVDAYAGEPERPHPLLNAVNPWTISDYNPWSQGGSSSGSSVELPNKRPQLNRSGSRSRTPTKRTLR